MDGRELRTLLASEAEVISKFYVIHSLNFFLNFYFFRMYIIFQILYTLHHVHHPNTNHSASPLGVMYFKDTKEKCDHCYRVKHTFVVLTSWFLYFFLI